MPLLHLVHAFFHIRELLLNLLEAVGFSGRAALPGIGEKFVADEGDADDSDRENYQTQGARLLRRRLFGRGDEYLPVKINTCHARLLQFRGNWKRSLLSCDARWISRRQQQSHLTRFARKQIHLAPCGIQALPPHFDLIFSRSHHELERAVAYKSTVNKHLRRRRRGAQQQLAGVLPRMLFQSLTIYQVRRRPRRSRKVLRLGRILRRGSWRRRV